MLDNKYFTSLPQNGSARFLYNQYKNNFFTSFNYVNTRMEKIYPNEVKIVQNILKTFENKDKVPSFLFYIYFEFLDVVRTNNVNKAAHLFNQFIKNDNYNDNKNSIDISHIKEEFWENDVITTYESQLISVQNTPDMQMKFNRITDIAIFDDAKNKIYQALELIKKYDYPLYEEINTYITDIKLHQGEVIVGLTSPKFFGTVFLSTPNAQSKNDCLYYVEHLIHEVSHLNLNILLSFDKLVLNGTDEKFPAPIRHDLRPMLGVFHATYVLSRMQRIFTRLKENVNPVSDNKFENLNHYFEDITFKFNKGYEVVKANAKMTKFGNQIVNSLCDTALC